MGDRPVAHTVVIPTPPGICGRGRTASLPALTGMTPLWQPGILRKDWQFVKRWNLILGLVVLFLSGVLVGALGTAIYFKQAMGHTFGESQPAIRKLVMKKLVRELDLTETQRARIEEVVGEVQTELWEFRKQHEREIETILARGIAQMKPELSVDQQRKLDALFERLKQHRHKAGGP